MAKDELQPAAASGRAASKLYQYDAKDSSASSRLDRVLLWRSGDGSSCRPRKPVSSIAIRVGFS